MKNETKQMIIEEYALREMAEYCEGLMVALQHPEEHIPESNEVIAAAIKSAERMVDEAELVEFLTLSKKFLPWSQAVTQYIAEQYDMDFFQEQKVTLQ